MYYIMPKKKREENSQNVEFIFTDGRQIKIFVIGADFANIFQ